MQLSEMNGSLRAKDWRDTEKEQSTRSALIKELLQKQFTGRDTTKLWFLSTCIAN